MDERTFWQRLEFRICGETASFPELNLHHWWWCDGIYPWTFDPDEGIFDGQAWIGRKDDVRIQHRWTFDLFLPPPPTPRESIPWSDLLPADATHGWLDLHPERKHLIIRLKPGQLLIPKTEPEEPN